MLRLVITAFAAASASAFVPPSTLGAPRGAAPPSASVCPSVARADVSMAIIAAKPKVKKVVKKAVKTSAVGQSYKPLSPAAKRLAADKAKAAAAAKRKAAEAAAKARAPTPEKAKAEARAKASAISKKRADAVAKQKAAAAARKKSAAAARAKAAAAYKVKAANMAKAKAAAAKRFSAAPAPRPAKAAAPAFKKTAYTSPSSGNKVNPALFSTGTMKSGGSKVVKIQRRQDGSYIFPTPWK